MPEVAFTPSLELYPFESRWFESSVGRVHYVDEGDGTPLLMLHGNPTWSFLYRSLIRSLSDRFRCVAIDYPGFGLSVRPDRYGYTPAEHADVVAELVDELGLDGMIVMGHDWGGPIGMAVAAPRAQRVRGLALGNTWFWPSDWWVKGFSRVMSSSPMKRAIIERNFFVERLIPAGTTRTLSREEMDHYRGVQAIAADRAGIAEFPRQLEAASSWLGELEGSVRRELGSKRTLITWPMRDWAFRASKLIPRMRAALPQSLVVELPTARHYMQEDAPGEIASAIRERFV